MNIGKLKEAEATFLQVYPKGFRDPAIAAIRKKHNVDALIDFTRTQLTRTRCRQPHFVADTLLSIVSRSSMVSRFEKPPFRRFIETLGFDEREALAHAVEQRLFGRRQAGFEAMVELLARHRIAKWPVVSAVPFYHAPRREAFLKPTTAKRILAFLEVSELRYQSRPTWEFYRGYVDVLSQVRRNVRASLSPNNAALSGFLMMTT